jgi:hypothetical protein
LVLAAQPRAGGLVPAAARPDVVIFQWWTGTVLHTYIALALLTRLLGGRVVIEFHEVLDTGEVNIPLAHAYVRTFARC